MPESSWNRLGHDRRRRRLGSIIRSHVVLHRLKANPRVMTLGHLYRRQTPPFNDPKCR
jgi:hypothetical protein